MREFIREKLGSKYVEARTIEFSKSFAECSNITPIFFILSAGVDPLKDVEKIGKRMKYSGDHGNFHNVSLGQGQEIVAENAIEVAARHGHWVILQVSYKEQVLSLEIGFNLLLFFLKEHSSRC